MHSKIKLYFRGRGRAKILPVTGTDGENSIQQLGHKEAERENPNAYRVYSPNGLSPCLGTMQGGGREPSIAFPVLTPDRTEKRQNGRRFKENGEPMFTLTAQDKHGVAIGVEPKGILRTVRSEFGKRIRNDYESGKFKISRHKFLEYEIKTDGCSNTIDSVQKDNLLALKCNISEIHGNGIYVEMPEGFMVYAIWYEKEQCYIAIRRLTPKECFRLQGWTDDYFERAAFVNSDSQLYKQAGNGVTVDVTYAIGKKIAECEKKSLKEFQKHMNKPEKAKQTKE